MLKLFPSAAGLEVTWHSIVKIGQSLYREAPGMDVFRPDQVTPVDRFFLAGSYTKQDYIDSMCVLFCLPGLLWPIPVDIHACREGATLSGRLCAGKIVEAVPHLASSVTPALVAA